MDLVGKNLAVNLPEGDPGRAYTELPPAEQRMLERGQLGRKARELGAVPADLGEVLFTDTPQGELAWQVFGGTLRYAAGLVPEIADDIVNVDNAIRWGFNWVHGPFEMLDHIGPARVIDRGRRHASPVARLTLGLGRRRGDMARRRPPRGDDRTVSAGHPAAAGVEAGRAT